MITPEEQKRLDEIKELASKATEGFWIASASREHGIAQVSAGQVQICTLHGTTQYQRESDSMFIAASRTAIPFLLSLVERLRKDGEDLVSVLDDMKNEAECQVASEKLGGNIVKEEFWKGRLSAIQQIQATLREIN